MIIYAEQGNREKRISEADIQTYVEAGYTIRDERGNVIKETIPVDVPSLRLGYTKKDEEIKELKAQIESLTSELDKNREVIASLNAEVESLKATTYQPTFSTSTSSKRGRKEKVTDTDTES